MAIARKHFVGSVDGDWYDGDARLCRQLRERRAELAEVAVHAARAFGEDDDGFAAFQRIVQLVERLPDVAVQLH